MSVSSPLPLSELQVTVAGKNSPPPHHWRRTRGMEQVVGLRDRQQPPPGDRRRLLLLPQPPTPTAEGPEQGEGAPQLTLWGVAPSPPSMDRTMPSPLTTASPPPWWAPPWPAPGATAPTQKRHRRGGWRWGRRHQHHRHLPLWPLRPHPTAGYLGHSRLWLGTPLPHTHCEQRNHEPHTAMVMGAVGSMACSSMGAMRG